MTAVAISVFALACADLARSGDRVRRRELAIGVAAAASVLGVLLLGAFGVEELVLVVIGVATVVAWVMTTGRAMSSRAQYGLPLAILAVGLLVQVVALGWLPARERGGLLAEWVERVPLAGAALEPSAVLLVGGALLAQISTANIVVRLVLASVGALKPAGLPQASDRLRGGRLLGPMERLLILGLGLSGQPTAAGIVIAAKGLIRFPELQAQARRQGAVDEPGIDELTEYFLIGSFVSWLFALASLAFIVVFA